MWACVLFLSFSLLSLFVLSSLSFLSFRFCPYFLSSLSCLSWFSFSLLTLTAFLMNQCSQFFSPVSLRLFSFSFQSVLFSLLSSFFFSLSSISHCLQFFQVFLTTTHFFKFFTFTFPSRFPFHNTCSLMFSMSFRLLFLLPLLASLLFFLFFCFLRFLLFWLFFFPSFLAFLPFAHFLTVLPFLSFLPNCFSPPLRLVCASGSTRHNYRQHFLQAYLWFLDNMERLPILPVPQFLNCWFFVRTTSLR